MNIKIVHLKKLNIKKIKDFLNLETYNAKHTIRPIYLLCSSTLRMS